MDIGSFFPHQTYKTTTPQAATLLTGLIAYLRLFAASGSGTGTDTFLLPDREGFAVPLYLPSILLTQPWLTRSCREISHGRTPWWASSTILWRTTSGRGRPFTKTPPSWFTPPCPKTHRGGGEGQEKSCVRVSDVSAGQNLQPQRSQALSTASPESVRFPREEQRGDLTAAMTLAGGEDRPA